MANSEERVQGIIFDLDGTLVVQHLDFETIRREIGLPAGTPLLEALEKMPTKEADRAHRILERYEWAAADQASPLPGVLDFLQWVRARGVRTAILTRNTRAVVPRILERCGLSFETVIAREDAPYKPDPEGIHRIRRQWGLAPRACLMVGDYLYDLQAGANAGTRTALITHGRDWHFAHLADVTFSSFEPFPESLGKLFTEEGETHKRKK